VCLAIGYPFLGPEATRASFQRSMCPRKTNHPTYHHHPRASRPGDRSSKLGISQPACLRQRRGSPVAVSDASEREWLPPLRNRKHRRRTILRSSLAPDNPDYGHHYFSARPGLSKAISPVWVAVMISPERLRFCRRQGICSGKVAPPPCPVAMGLAVCIGSTNQETFAEFVGISGGCIMEAGFAHSE
jgi:hypothetical protein